MALDPTFKRFALMHTHAKLPQTAIGFQMAKAGHCQAVIDEFFRQLSGAAT
jgi:hypothetical protein